MNQTFSSQSFDPRPASPGQLAVAGLVVWLVGALLPGLHILATIGLILLVVAGVGYLIRPRSRTMYWRGRQLDLGDPPGAGQRAYRAIFKH